MNDSIYFAGAFCRKGHKNEFQLVHCANEKRPYLTHNPNGLQLCRLHSSLYRASSDLKHAECVRFDNPDSPVSVTLTDEQQDGIKKSDRNELFF